MDLPKHKILSLVVIWLIWTFATLIYFQQYYLRVIVGSLSHYLMLDFFLTIVDLTDLSVLFFMAYIIALPIAGILLDRYGVKKMLLLASLVMTVSSFLFANSHNDTELSVARALMGFSGAFTLISTLIIIRKYFKASLFPILSGLTLSAGILGCVIGNWFLVEFSSTYNWRILLSYTGWLFLALGPLFFISIHLHEKKEQEMRAVKKTGFKTFFKDVKTFLNQWRNWLPGIYGGFIIAPIVSFACFWSSPFLRFKYQMTEDDSVYFTSYIMVGYAVGLPIIALFVKKIRLKSMMVFFAGLELVIMLLLINYTLYFSTLKLCLFLLGFTAGAYCLTTILTKLSTQNDIAACAFSFTNMLSEFIAALTLWSMGEYIYYLHGVKITQSHRVYSPIVLDHTIELLTIASFMALVVACLVRPPCNSTTDTTLIAS